MSSFTRAPPSLSPVSPRLRVGGPFVMLLLLSLATVSASVLAGLLGIKHLDATLREVTRVDAQRLITVTHVRRLFRSEVVLEHQLETASEPDTRARVAHQRERVRSERAVALARLGELGVLGQEQAYRELRDDHEQSHEPLHGLPSRWEAAVATILEATERRLEEATRDAEVTSRMAATRLLGTSGVAVVLASLLGVVILRRVRAASLELSRSEQRFRTVVQSAPSVLVKLAADRSLLYLPPRAAGDLGWPLAELSRDFLIWVGESDRNALGARIDASLAGSEEQVPLRVEARRSDGRTWSASVSATGLTEVEGGVRGVILQILDVSEQCRAEDAQARLEEQLRHAQKMETIGRLAGGIAHDFNNLLTAIKGYGSLAAQDPKSPEVPEYLDGILAAADRAGHLTRQLLAFSRKHVIAPVPTDLGQLARGMEKLLGRLIGEDVQLEVRVSAELSPCLVDPHQVEQVIMNLAINARDAMPTGGHLLVEVSEVELDEGYTSRHPTVTPGPYVLLSVTDTGTGMPPEILEQAFEPFFTTKPAGQGTGLGLSVVYGAVHQHGGTLDVYSDVGLGTCVRVYWPRLEEPRVAEPDRGETELRLRGQELVLVVEDDPLVRAFTAKVLLQHGYRVLVADSAAEALRLAHEASPALGLLLTDVILPDKSGPDLAREIAVGCRDLPVLYTSGYSNQLLAQRGRLAAGVAYLPKPYDVTTLLTRIRETIEGGRRASAPEQGGG